MLRSPASDGLKLCGAGLNRGLRDRPAVACIVCLGPPCRFPDGDLRDHRPFASEFRRRRGRRIDARRRVKAESSSIRSPNGK
jgi:hypothetical protein